MNTPVSFEIAKLLKEKEYPQFIEYLGILVPNTAKCYADSFGNLYDRSNYDDYPEFYTKEISAPIIAEVIMWLYKKWGLWVFVKLGYGNEFVIQSSKSPFNFIYSDGTYNSPEEAYEAGIEYVLKNLI